MSSAYGTRRKPFVLGELFPIARIALDAFCLGRSRTLARVLIVEDDDGHRETIAELLHDAGYLVDCAIHGKEALDHLRQGLLPCVILLDLTMPVMNGFDFRRHQLANPTKRNIADKLSQDGQT